MKITIDRKTLADALTTVKSAATSKGSLPILSNVRVGVFDKSVDFTCTNMEQYLRVKVEATITGTGDNFTVKASLFHDLVKSFIGDTVEIDTSKKNIDIRCGQSKYHLGIMDAEEFPSWPRVTAVSEFSITQAFLRTLLTTTAFCSRTAEPGRPVLQGSLFQVNGNITAVGCDGRRLAMMSGPLEEKAKAMDVIVPCVTVAELLRLVPDDEDKKIAVGIGEKMIQFQFGATTVISKIIDGKYPDYTKIIPKLEGAGVAIGRADLLTCLHRVSLIDERCNLEFRQQTLTISAESENKDIPGDAQESLLIPKSAEMKGRFTTPYLIEALEAVKDDEVLYYGGPGGQGIFKVSGKSWLSLTAPLTVKPKSAPAETKKPEPAKK